MVVADIAWTILTLITAFSFLVVVKVKGGWRIRSKSGKWLSKVFSSKTEAEKRLKQIEAFKHMGSSRNR